MQRLANVAAVAATVFLVLFTVWAVVPAPRGVVLLALAVFVPEHAIRVDSVVFVVGLFAFLVARGTARRLALALTAIAFACPLVSIVEYPFARAAIDRQVRAALGPENLATDADATDTFTVVRDVPVTLRDGARLTLDRYTPNMPGPHPTIVTLYGGAWVFGNPGRTADLARDFAARGYTVIAIAYRLAPTYHFPTQLDDVDDALATIAKNARAWNVDPHRVALVGRSAGAELALLAAYERQPLTIRAAVGLYTPTDLAGGYAHPPKPDPSNVRRMLTTYVGATPSEAPAAYRRASPLAAVRADLPPTLLISGDRDELIPVRFQRAMRDALRAHGDDVLAIEIPWSNHGFDEFQSGLGTSIASGVERAFLHHYVK